MVSKLAAVAVLSLAAGVASAAPCPDVLGPWSFTLSCGAATAPPHFGARTMDGEVTHQEGCVFVGTLLGRAWVGVLSGAGNRTVTFDFAGAKAQGELGDRRGGLYREMSVSYTYEGTGGADPPTACAGTATRG
jgi:hypothetical protein